MASLVHYISGDIVALILRDADYFTLAWDA
jgi:hypothetical protein